MSPRKAKDSIKYRLRSFNRISSPKEKITRYFPKLASQDVKDVKTRSANRGSSPKENISLYFPKVTSQDVKDIAKTKAKTSPKRQTKTPENKEKKEIQLIKSKNLYLPPSAKFEQMIPKVEDILREEAEGAKFKEIQELVKIASTKFLQDMKRKTQSRKKPLKRIKMIDCKHISLRNIENKFKKDAKYLDDIFHGVKYNERHELFKKGALQGILPEADLRCNEVTWTFTNEQLIHIVSLFRNRYDNGNKYKWSDYYFKVLLPEFCIKIFMDYHKMDHEKTMEYLKLFPVSNNLNIS